MVNPSLLQQLAREYRHEDRQAARTHGMVLQLSRHPIRERLGWSLMTLGARLTRDPLTGDPWRGTPVHGRHGRGAYGAGARRARTSVPLARL